MRIRGILLVSQCAVLATGCPQALDDGFIPTRDLAENEDAIADGLGSPPMITEPQNDPVAPLAAPTQPDPTPRDSGASPNSPASNGPVDEGHDCTEDGPDGCQGADASPEAPPIAPEMSPGSVEAMGEDLCPDHPNQQLPGACGCGYEKCESLAEALIHRYSFDDVGNLATDTISGADGIVVGSPLTGNGTYEMDGVSDHIDLPGGLLRALENATMETWVRWNGGAIWQRIFDFGGNGDSENDRYLFLTPVSRISTGMCVGYRGAGSEAPSYMYVDSPFPVGQLVHLALVRRKGKLELFQDGQRVAQQNISVDLGTLEDTVNRIGRSLTAADPYFSGDMAEFRIYSEALDQKEVVRSFEAGPDPEFLEFN